MSASENSMKITQTNADPLQKKIQIDAIPLSVKAPGWNKKAQQRIFILFPWRSLTPKCWGGGKSRFIWIFISWSKSSQFFVAIYCCTQSWCLAHAGKKCMTVKLRKSICACFVLDDATWAWEDHLKLIDHKENLSEWSYFFLFGQNRAAVIIRTCGFKQRNYFMQDASICICICNSNAVF